jgi:hypothetical protein
LRTASDEPAIVFFGVPPRVALGYYIEIFKREETDEVSGLLLGPPPWLPFLSCGIQSPCVNLFPSFDAMIRLLFSDD